MANNLTGIFFIFVLSSLIFAHSMEDWKIIIYKSAGCGHCVPYLEGLMDELTKAGVKDIQNKEFLGNEQVRVELANLQDKVGVPLNLQGHLVVSIDDGSGSGYALFEGHVPPKLIVDFLANDHERQHKGTVVTQDAMDLSTVKEYFHFKDGITKTCGINEKIIDCEKQESPASGGSTASFEWTSILIPVLIVIVPMALIWKLWKEEKKSS
ncbi:MAG: hypothetical protein AABW86_02160 [Candidatus Micrarchaeota archaeon]